MAPKDESHLPEPIERDATSLVQALRRGRNATLWLGGAMLALVGTIHFAANPDVKTSWPLLLIVWGSICGSAYGTFALLQLVHFVVFGAPYHVFVPTKGSDLSRFRGGARDIAFTVVQLACTLAAAGFLLTLL